MSFTAGVFSINSAGQPVVTGTVISATAFNALTADLATGLSTCLLKDGTQAATAVIPFASGITLAAGSTLANYVTTTFSPTVTLVGGAGNTVPVYSTNTGRYTRIGARIFVDILLSGDGGAEGAGTGQFTIALPVAVNASSVGGTAIIGQGINNTTSYQLFGSFTGGASVMSVNYWSSVTAVAGFTGADQNNATRSVRMSFVYEA